MPAISNPVASTVLVTGSNGFIASWIVDDLLRTGYIVRAAVRTEERGAHLKETYKRYSDEGKLEILAVGDMTIPGAWDKAVQGVEGVIHAAASVHLNAKTPEEMINPAVKAVLEILESVRKYGTKVQRFVYTSSCGTLSGFSSVPVTLSEENWNDQAVNNCKELGEKALPNDMYCASKTLAEQELWKWYNAHKRELNWDVVTLLPPWVFGPVKHHVPSITSLNASNLFWYQATILGQYGATAPPYDDVNPLTIPSHGWIDVRDVARGHTLALSVPDAGGERICLIGGPFVWQDAVDATNAVEPSPWISHHGAFAKGHPDGTQVHNIIWKTEKAQRILGIKYRTLEETAKDILVDYEEHDWN